MSDMTAAELRAARGALGLSQRQLGAALGYPDAPGTRQIIARMERGEKPVPPAQARLVRAYLAGYRPDDWPGAPLSSI